MNRWIIDAGVGEEGIIRGVVTCRRVIGCHIDRVRRHRYRIWEVHLLPARGGFVGKSRRGKRLAARGPQVTHMRAGVGRSLVKANSGDKTIEVNPELHPEFHAVGIVDGCGAWCGRAAPSRAGAGRSACSSK